MKRLTIAIALLCAGTAAAQSFRDRADTTDDTPMPLEIAVLLDARESAIETVDNIDFVLRLNGYTGPLEPVE